VQLTPPVSSCSIQIGRGLTDAPVGSLRSIYLVVTDLEAVRSRLLERGVEVGEIRHKTPIDAWDGVLHPGSTRRTGTTPASPTSRTRMAIAESCRNEGTALREVEASRTSGSVKRYWEITLLGLANEPLVAERRRG